MQRFSFVCVRGSLDESLPASFLALACFLCRLLYRVAFALFIDRAGEMLGPNLEARVVD